MTKELAQQQTSLQNSRPATERELIIELEKLAVIFHRADMTQGKWRLLFLTFIEDFRGKTLAEIQFGCERYRKNKGNDFFPTPGKLLDACQNPYTDPVPRRYSQPTPFGDTIPVHRAQAVIDATRQKYNLALLDPLQRHKDEVLARPPLPYVERTPEQREAIMEVCKRMEQSIRDKDERRG